MKLGITGATYSRFKEARYQRMKEHGYSFCDLGLQNTEHPLYHCSEEELKVLLLNEKKLAEDAGIGFYQVHGPWRYPPRDATPEDQEERKGKMRRALLAAKLLGASYVVIHPIYPFGVKGMVEPELVFRMNVEFFRDLIPAAKAYGVCIAIENMPHPEFPLAAPEMTLKLVETLDDPAIQICLDTGHSAVMGVQPAEAVRKLGNRVKVLHVHDKNGQGDHRIPYDGVVDWEDFAAALKETNFSGVLSLETRPPNAKLNDVPFLAQTGATALIARQIADMTE